MDTTVSISEDPPDGDVSLYSASEKYNIFNIFINSGLHQVPHVKVNDVYAIVVIKTDRETLTKIVKNNKRKKKDAEAIVIQIIQDYCSKNTGFRETVLSVKMWVNFSPCSNCCELILNWQRHFPPITICFPSLYRIRRESCIEKGCKCITEFPENKKRQQIEMHNQIVAGLNNLALCGVTLKTFDEQAWREVQDVLGITGDIPGTRKTEDKAVQKDFLYIIMSNDNNNKNNITPFTTLRPSADIPGKALPQCL